MIKKLIIIIVTLFVGVCFVEAATDYSLLYDVTEFNVTDEEVQIKGFAVRHNFNNIKPVIKIYFSDSSGNEIYNFKVSNTDASLYDWYCSRNAYNSCSYGYQYTDVGFEATLNFDEFYKSDNFRYDAVYTLKIQVCLKNVGCSKVEDLGVMEDVVTGNNNRFEISSSSKKMEIYTNYSRLLSENWGYGSIQGGSVYWKQGEKYNVVGIIKGGSTCTSGATNYSYCPNLYKLAYGTINGSCNLWGLSGYRVSPGSNCTAYASAAWVKPNGKVTVKYVGQTELEVDDKVCNVNDDIANSCSSKVFENDCDQMKIRTTTDDGTILSAIVAIDEKGEFRIKDYSNTVVTAGRSFAFGLKYVYNLNWNYSSYVCNGVNEEICKDLLYSKVLATEDYFGKANVNTLLSNLNQNGVVQASGYSFQNDANLENAGAWTCQSSNSLSDGHLTIVCDYKIKDAYINYYTNYITYEDKSGNIDDYKNLGTFFYLPLNYNKENFKWNITTDNLSLIKVRTIKNDYDSTDASSWKINTTGNSSNKCSVQVRDNIFTTNNTSELVYRSVNTSVDEENLNLYYLVQDTNWYRYFYSSSNGLNSSRLARINDSYNNLHYRTKVLTKQIIREMLYSYDNQEYTSWNDITNLGLSNLVRDNNYFNIENNSIIHCEWGEFGDNCDKY